MKESVELVVVGGGPAGLAAALEAEKNGVRDIVILERDRYLGGILPQCIHNGFGLEYFNEELTGPEYAHRFIEPLKDSNIDVRTETMVIDITPDKEITALNRQQGIIHLQARAIVLAMGCRERTRENLKIPGDRLSGVLTAGTAQRYTNIEGYMPGKEVVILGSGDIGLIMARRMRLEGADVKAVLEIMPYSSGLVRNKVQCLDDYDIPLKLRHTIDRIEGEDRVERVRVVEVDDNFNTIEGSQQWVECDTVLLSVGLIPENELSKGMGLKLHPVNGGPYVNEMRETNLGGVFACGNVLQVHDLVDWVTEESEIAGRAVHKYLSQDREYREQPLELVPGDNVTYIVPDKIDFREEDRNFIKLFMRVTHPIEDVEITLFDGDHNQLVSYNEDIVAPGEMVTANLPEALIDDTINQVMVSIIKKEGEHGDNN